MGDPCRDACAERCAGFGDPPCYDVCRDAGVPWIACDDCLRDCDCEIIVEIDPDAVVRNLL